MRVYTVKKGKHRFRSMFSSVSYLKRLLPIRTPLENNYTGEIQFEQSCRYILSDKEQLDGNKGGGITSYFSANNADAILGAWRYVPKRDKIELAVYLNNSEKEFKWIVIGDINLGYSYSIRFDFKKLGLKVNVGSGKNKLHSIQLTNRDLEFVAIRIARGVPLWFGGDNRAPNTMNVLWKFKKN